ncbi:elongin-A isoform X2 [Cottoperca gobio]|uniref:Elongin-A isoform X2 n=1 Tax=Cottoperca gobio TaxID=56716 RepID=A0A6J2QP33_COTGO|nr:elongin-A isoform X2 [Cottoperca gobio]
MAEDLLETVDRLQSRLLENPEPRKLLKTFKRLGELPMTVDILVETGVGKTVNSFRKHQLAGEVAKGLVAKWKKLVPQSADRPTNSHVKEAPRSHTHSRGPEAGGGGGGHRRTREPSPEEEPSFMEEEEEEEEEEERGYHTNYSPSPPQHEQYSPPQRGGYRSDEYESPEHEPEREPEREHEREHEPEHEAEADPEPSPSPSPPRKEVRHVKPNKEPNKNHHHGSHSDKNRDRDEERRQRHAEMSSDRGVREGDEGKKRSADREQQQSPVQKSAKHSRKSTTHESKREEKKKGGDDGRPRAPKDSLPKEVEDDFDAPTMSFESFLTYDAPTPVKKKKKPSSSSSSSHSRPSHPSSSTSSSHRSRTPPPAPSSTSSSSKGSKANGTQSTKRSHSGSSSASTEKRKSRVVEVVATLPEIPLPAIQPNYRPLPSIDVSPLSPQRRKVPVSNDEEDSGFTGKRFNSKMTVYSGSKTAYLPRMMTLYEQCIRVLQNNIDSIAEVGGVPFEILEPVLERCTPEQLYRIEQSNQWFTEESDELWMRHCQRDFKRESPQEYESWREMYLRLHDEREERLRMLTQNISSAHANKPKGRQVKMAFVNSVAKPPRDVRRRQEKFGTISGSSASSTAAAAPIKIRPATIDYSGETMRSSSSQFNPSPSSSRSSAAAAAAGGAAAAAAAAAGPAGRDKPQVKKIAPMMAKTIKAFKNRFSRR